MVDVNKILEKVFESKQNEIVTAGAEPGDQDWPNQSSKYAKAILAAHGREEHPSDSEDPKNFEINTKKGPEPRGTAFVKEQHDLIAEMHTLLDAICEHCDQEDLQDIAEQLRSTHQTLTEDLDDTETELVETYVEGGRFKLNDGTTVTLSRNDAHALNSMFENAGAKHLEQAMLKNRHEFSAVLRFAHGLMEDEE